jgi:protein gp37
MVCQRISPACEHCYAETLVTNRMGYNGRRLPILWGPRGERKVTSDANWRNPVKWNAEAAKTGEFWPVFCASLADVFEDRRELDAPRERLFRLIEETPHLTWLLLTKRIDRVNDLKPARWIWFPDHVGIGTTVESQRYLDERLPVLQTINAKTRWLSIEPQIEAIEYGEQMLAVDWAITGGESGPGCRPYDPQWASDLIAAGRRFGFAPFVKQLGEAWARTNKSSQRHGAEPLDWAPALRVQEFPRGLTTARLAAKAGVPLPLFPYAR